MIYAMGLIGLCLAWLLPGHFFPWTGFQQETLAATGTGLVALAALTSTGRRPLPSPRLTLCPALLATVPLMQWRLGMIPFFADALLPALYLLAFPLAVIAGAAVYKVKRETFVVGLFSCFIAAATVSTGIGMAQWLQLGTLGYVELMDAGGRVYGNLTQPNHLASLLGLGIVGVLWLYETRRIRGAVACLAIAFLGWGLVMTQSRSGWVGMIVISAWILISRRRLGLRTTPQIVFGACLMFAVALTGWQPLNALLQESTGPSLGERMHAGTRLIHWATFLDAATRSPWVGYGWQQVGIAQQLVTLDHLPTHEWTGYTHDLLIDLLVWTGIPLGLLIFGAVVWWLVTRARACGDIDSWAMLGATGVLGVHAMVEFPLAYAYFLLPLGLMIGIIETHHPRSGSMPSMPRAVFAFLLAATLGMLTWIGTEYLDVEEAARRVAFKEAGYVSAEQPRVPDVTLLDNQREFLRFRLTPAREGMSAEQLDWMRRVSQRFAPPAAMLRYALAAGLNDRGVEAERTLRLLCHMWTPKNCVEGREAWKIAQKQWPGLREIDFPASPNERTAGARQ